MSKRYGKTNFDDVADLAPKFGTEDVGAEGIGATLYRMNPDRRTGFGHRHAAVEELYVVLSGSGRVKIDDDVLDMGAFDAVRVAPEAVREFESGPDGMVLLATGTHADGDGELVQGFWPAD